LWAYLNWALGLRALGCRVIWLESVMPTDPLEEVRAKVITLKNRLARYNLADSVTLCSSTDRPLPFTMLEHCLPLEAATEADLLLNLSYGLPTDVVRRFCRSVMLDIDPGLTQIWISRGHIRVPTHDVYFTIGETVGQPTALFPDCGLKWQYTPPCVALDWWPQCPTAADASFTTVSNWIMRDWVDHANESYPNDKRTGFLPFLDLPSRTTQPLEMALCLAGCDDERLALLQRGWRVREAHEITATPWDYQHYIQGSRGEFSCAKPSYSRLQTAWISDRTLCYLASGKPAVVQHTGPSRFLPENAGLFRFHNLEEAARGLEQVAAEYDRQCELARALAEKYFDAKKVVERVLGRAMT
jgi:hypothetical protein